MHNVKACRYKHLKRLPVVYVQHGLRQLGLQAPTLDVLHGKVSPNKHDLTKHAIKSICKNSEMRRAWQGETSA
jgi:hypothetical protein